MTSPSHEDHNAICDLLSQILISIESPTSTRADLESHISVATTLSDSDLSAQQPALSAALARLANALRGALEPSGCIRQPDAAVREEVANVRAVLELRVESHGGGHSLDSNSAETHADSFDDEPVEHTDTVPEPAEEPPAMSTGNSNEVRGEAPEDPAVATADAATTAPPSEPALMPATVGTADTDAPHEESTHIDEVHTDDDEAYTETPDDDGGWGSTLIELDEDRAELLQFMVADVRRCIAEIEPIVAEAREYTSRQDAADRLVRLAEEMSKVSEFFAFASFDMIVDVLKSIGRGLGTIGDAQLDELCMRVRAIGSLLDQYCSGLEVGMELSWPLDTMQRRIGLLLEGKSLHPQLVEWHRGDPERVLELDGVTESIEELPTPDPEFATGPSASAFSQSAETKPADRTIPSIRVAQPSFESMLDITRQLVLNKNQIEGIAVSADSNGLDRASSDLLSLRAAELSRLVKRLQHVLNATSVQPLSAILDRYRRMLLDVAHIKNKELDFCVNGADIEIDTFVLNAIADPLGRLLRDAVSRAIETTDERVAAGKPAAGVLRIEAENHESHISIIITHDGRARDAESIRIEAAGCDNAPPNLEGLSDEEIRLLPLAGWYPTGETAGVLEAFLAQRASISMHERDGRETITIVLPLVGAVIGTMNVRVGAGVYAIPVKAIQEIVTLASNPIQSVGGEPVLRIRDALYPMTRCADVFGDASGDEPRFAVIVDADGTRAALGVDQVLGHQEIVIEPMGLPDDAAGPFLGAAIRGDGDVCLVIDVRHLVRGTATPAAKAA